jgi:hypothetical protein
MVQIHPTGTHSYTLREYTQDSPFNEGTNLISIHYDIHGEITKIYAERAFGDGSVQMFYKKKDLTSILTYLEDIGLNLPKKV